MKTTSTKSAADVLEINSARASGNEDMRLVPGMRVRAKTKQYRLGPPKYPGRTGVVERRNAYSSGPMDASSGGLWYVRLDATVRGLARVETFFGKDLEQADESERTMRRNEEAN